MDGGTTTSPAPAGGSWRLVDRPVVSAREQLAADVRRGLAEEPPSLPPKWFYDEKGSLLFEEITELEEYYPTRAEESILVSRSAEIAALTQARVLVELGSGSSKKTRLLLSAVRPACFVPLDVSREILADSARAISADFGIEVVAMVADFEQPLPELPADGVRLMCFLGGTIGNLGVDARADFLRRVRDSLAPGDFLLLGADLVKDPARLVAAYDDARGVTAAFNLNVLHVLNRELGGDIDVDAFEHVARWNPEESRIEMWLRARRHVTAVVDGFVWELPAGGEVLTEISTKFTVASVAAELESAGFAVVEQWLDDAGDFSLTLARLA